MRTVLVMEVSDHILSINRDWDPGYLMDIFAQDFYEFNDLWKSSVDDCSLVEQVEKLEKYEPIVEDISIDDETLCTAVENIENE